MLCSAVFLEKNIVIFYVRNLQSIKVLFHCVQYSFVVYHILGWNAHKRPLSFSHQEVSSQRIKSQLRHSYSQREVSHHSSQENDYLPRPSTDLNINPIVTKSTPVLKKECCLSNSNSSISSQQSTVQESGGNSMVTRHFKKGSVYDTLASASGLDFSPVVQLKSFSSRRDDINTQIQASKSIEKPNETCATHEDYSSNKNENTNSNETQEPVTSVYQTNNNEISSACIAAHEKYPSWPVVSEVSLNTQRSHSWIGQTEYIKEKIVYSRPKKDHQYKISTNQLQPVLERASDNPINIQKSRDWTHLRESSQISCHSSVKDCNGKQFDFEAFHTPCIPKCYEGKDCAPPSPPERDGSSNSEPISKSSGIQRHERLFEYNGSWSNQQSNTPFLDRLRLENAWPSPPVQIPQVAVPLPQQGNDSELSSENGTWMGSMESSSHGRGVPKWQGSYSDLSILSTQLSNRSSLFDSGHSTMPESGRLSPQSSCDSLLIEGPTRAQVVARHGHREIVAHSARVQQPERYGSESVLYYAKSCRPSDCANKSTENPKTMSTDDAMFRSHASLTLNAHNNNEVENKNWKRPTKQDSENSLHSSTQTQCLNDSGALLDTTNAANLLNYKNLEKYSSGNVHIGSFSKYKPPKSKSIDESTEKPVIPERRQRASDPELKAFQKQAVLSFYQRMSLAESTKSDSLVRLRVPKLSLPSNKPPKGPQVQEKSSDNSLLNNYSKSVPNLMTIKGHNFDLPPSHPFFKRASDQKKVFPMVKDEIISWDQLPCVFEKKRDSMATSTSDAPGDFGGCSSFLKVPRKVQLKEVHHSNETASIQVVTSEGVTLVQTSEKKRRPPPPLPPKQPPKRPPPPPPPLNEISQPPLSPLNSHYTFSEEMEHPSTPELPPPPPATEENEVMNCDEPLPPPPDLSDIKISSKLPNNSSMIYPKNSYMSYRSEKKLSRQGFDGNYRRSFQYASSVDLSTDDEEKQFLCSWEQEYSKCHQKNHSSNNCQDIPRQDHISSDNIIIQSVIQDSLHRAVPYCAPSQENLNTPSDFYQNLHRSVGLSSNISSDLISKSYLTDATSDTLTDCNSENIESNSIVDYNQNSLLNNHVEENDLKLSNENTILNHMNSSQIYEFSNLHRKLVKTQELNCEQIDREIFQHYGDITFKSLFIPPPNHKTLSHYMENVLNFLLETNHKPVDLSSIMSVNNQREENVVKSLISDELGIENDIPKEELIISIKKKLEILRGEQNSIRLQLLKNNQIGLEISDSLKDLAKPHESEKYFLHVEELEKILNLLLSLSGRLVKTENILKNFSSDCSEDEKKTIESKRDKLKEQYEDACRLKESIDKRSKQVSIFLHKYFSDEEYAKYENFIKMKTKFLVDIREIDEKINLGEEQLAALSVVSHVWKSANY